MAQPQRCSVRKYATEGHVDGRKQLIYVASCSCGARHQTRSKSSRNRWADDHIS